MPQLDPASFPSQIFWLIISFAILYIGLSKVFLPKISKIFETRESKIASFITQSEAAQKESEKIDHYISEKLAQTRAKAKDMIATTLMQINKMKAEKESSLDAEFAKMLDNSNRNINQFKAEAEQEIESISFEAAKFALKEFVNISVSDDDLKAKIVNMKRTI